MIYIQNKNDKRKKEKEKENFRCLQMVLVDSQSMVSAFRLRLLLQVVDERLAHLVRLFHLRL
jgi:hypothetical protein